jgi:hypothetical protein
MSSSQIKTIKGQYRVVSVEKTDPPEGMNGGSWHSYVIERGTSVVTGKKPGSLRAVTAHARQVVQDLNSRTGLNAGSLYAGRRRS